MTQSREMTIFLDAVEIESTADRDQFLQESCGADKVLLASVQGLIRSHFQTESVVDRVDPLRLVETLEGVVGRRSLPSSYSPNSVIGPYQLRQQIGEGGFGLVFVANQHEPIRRRVALKIIKPGMDSPEVIARFEAERQALAMMDHANIARVYDAGITELGHPFFVMELVEGQPLIEFSDRCQLTTKDRLELFVSICQAVQYAHQKGIIHRDLKPSNILVSLDNAKPVAKVIDFGVAKAIGHSLTDKTIYTRFSTMIGTPSYMSPEQAEMSNLDVDTRTDVYSLGILLYELLTGSTPLSEDRASKVGFDDLRRIIREEEVERPSQRLSTLSDKAANTVSLNRRLDPAQLKSSVSGDLDWIVMKAIDKDRTRRYSTAAALAEDITCFLKSEPVKARPPSAYYRFSKFVRRHAGVVVTASLVAVAVLIGFATSVWQARVATTALHDARIAESDATSAKEELQLFTERLKKANLFLTSGYAHVDAGNWAEGLASYSQATAIQPRYYPVWIHRGTLFAKLGLWEQAAADYERTLELGSPFEDIEYLGVPQLFLHTSREEAYHQLCEQLTRFGEIEGGAVSRALLADDHLSREVAKRIAVANEQYLVDDLRPNGMSSRKTSSHMPRAVRAYITGLAYFRAGEWEQAVTWLKQDKTVEGKPWAASGSAYPLIAMGYYEMGKTEDAQVMLDASKTKLNLWLEGSLASSEVSLPIPWYDWLEFLAHYEQAQRLIAGEVDPPHPLIEQHRLRARSAILPTDRARFQQ
ncbi:protein kinase [Bremerella sp. JC770]|uniref:protein kinase domain-containing protein n=1 Tax=Bremerella sp. JC770 TaxID=3232137 RepID=UPI003459A760